MLIFSDSGTVDVKKMREEREKRPGGSGEIPMTEEDIAASDKALDALARERAESANK